jgi:hypothetical protein
VHLAHVIVELLAQFRHHVDFGINVRMFLLLPKLHPLLIRGEMGVNLVFIVTFDGFTIVF